MPLKFQLNPYKLSPDLINIARMQNWSDITMINSLLGHDHINGHDNIFWALNPPRRPPQCSELSSTIFGSTSSYQLPPATVCQSSDHQTNLISFIHIPSHFWESLYVLVNKMFSSRGVDQRTNLLWVSVCYMVNNIFHSLKAQSWGLPWCLPMQ